MEQNALIIFKYLIGNGSDEKIKALGKAIGLDLNDEQIKAMRATVGPQNDRKAYESARGSEIRRTMMGRPEDWLVSAAGDIATNASRALGNTRANKGTALANALLATRSVPAAAEQIYGKSPATIAAEIGAANVQKKGQNSKAWFDALANVLGNATNEFNSAVKTARGMDAADQSGLSGSAIDAIRKSLANGKVAGGVE